MSVMAIRRQLTKSIQLDRAKTNGEGAQSPRWDQHRDGGDASPRAIQIDPGIEKTLATRDQLALDFALCAENSRHQG